MMNNEDEGRFDFIYIDAISYATLHHHQMKRAHLRINGFLAQHIVREIVSWKSAFT